MAALLQFTDNVVIGIARTNKMAGVYAVRLSINFSITEAAFIRRFLMARVKKPNMIQVIVHTWLVVMVGMKVLRK
jgi:hypothetical protein